MSQVRSVSGVPMTARSRPKAGNQTSILGVRFGCVCGHYCEQTARLRFWTRDPRIRGIVANVAGAVIPINATGVIELVNPAAERNHFGDLDVPKNGIKSTATLLAGVAEPLPGCGLVLCSGSILEVVADTSADERIARLLRVVGGTLIKTAGFVDRLGLNPPTGPIRTPSPL